MSESLTATSFADALHDALSPGTSIALGDGVGALRRLDDGTAVGEVLSAVARDIGSVRLILGWTPPIDGLDPLAFAEVVSLMPGWGARDALRGPSARFLPTRLAAVPALMADVLQPDVLLTRLVTRSGTLQFGSEVSWQRATVAGGVRTLGIVDVSAPAASAEPGLEPAAVEVLGTVDGGITRMPDREPEPIHDAIADAVLELIPAGARLQYGPGQLGTALLNRARVPLAIDTGLLIDAVVHLDQRGLLLGQPSATYLIGGDELYRWADGRPVLRGIDHSHDLTRLSRGTPFFAVNTAIEIDPWGQVNVEGFGEKVVGGIGGHPDFCAAARLSSGGLSIIAVPTRFQGRSPLVENLSRPASTPAHDVDVVVTETGHVDLRTADWARRRELLTELFARSSEHC